MAKKNSLFFKCLVEFIGTFIFLSIILTTGQALPIGIALMAAIYWGGSVSGGNFNPAVSFMMFLNKKMNMTQCMGFVISQLLGAALAYYYFKNTPESLVAKR